MHTDQFNWWLTILLNLAGYFIYRFGSSKNGRLSPLVEVAGGILLPLSFFVMGFLYGFKEVLALLFIISLPTILLSEALLFKGKIVKRAQEDSVQNDLKMLEKIMPGITKGDKKFKL